MTNNDWCDWLVKAETRLFNEYADRPQRLVSDFNGERLFTRDYDGREILELLQNANDASTKAGIRGRVHFELLPSGFISANTGSHFSPDGVSSLCLPHTSPKPSEGPLMVGNKGLGFRAVLNWTHFPIVLSGELSIIFSASVAKQKQAQLELLNGELRSAIERQKKLYGELVVPLLGFPGFDNQGNLGQFLDDETQQVLYGRCRELRESGYDTVIGIPFGKEPHHEAAHKQIKLLRPEVLLFAKSLAELEIVVGGEEPVCWRHDQPSGNQSRVFLGTGENDFREWTVHSRRGLVPSDYLPDNQVEPTQYEVVLAIPLNHKSEALYLYSFFPTEVRFPYPAVCHATLDLQANRQHPQNTPANHFILRQLAEFMAETAEHLARSVSPEDGLTLIAGEPGAADSLVVDCK
jgi:hypothetical protein